MDIEVCMEAKRVADKQVEVAKGEIMRRDEQIKALQEEIQMMHRKVLNTEKDRDQMRTIMTNNIGDAATKYAEAAAEIGMLKKKIRELEG